MAYRYFAKQTYHLPQSSTYLTGDSLSISNKIEKRQVYKPGNQLLIVAVQHFFFYKITPHITLILLTQTICFGEYFFSASV
jgi:hypothetical protein